MSPDATDTSQSGNDGGVVARVKHLAEWAKHTRIARALARYSAARGALLAGGITYVALFSVFAALAIGYTVFMWVLGGNEELRESVIDAIDQALPGILDTSAAGEDSNGMVSPDQLVVDSAINLTSVIAALVLLWSAMSVMNAIKISVRAMFGITPPKENIVVAKLRDLAGFIVLAFAVLLTAALGIAVGAAGQWVMDLIGVTGGFSAWMLRVLGFLLAAAVDIGVVALLLRALAGARAPRRDLLLGALLGGIAAAVLRQLGTSVVGAVDDPLLASFAALVTLLLWINILARILLIVAAFTANPPLAPTPRQASDTHYDRTPNYVTLSAPETVLWPHHAATGLVEMEPDVRDVTRETDLEQTGDSAEDVLGEHREQMADRKLGELEDAQREHDDEYWGGLVGAWRRRRRDRRLARQRRTIERREQARLRAERLKGDDQS